MSAIAQIEPMTTARALRGPFDYRLPEELRERVAVGSTLVVPFGRREILGVVTGLREHSEIAEERLLAPLRALDGEHPAVPTLPPDLVALAQWLAVEYCSTLARSFALVLPPAATRRLSGRKRRLPRRAEHVRVGPVRPAPVLTDEQERAVAELCSALDSDGACTRLLAGITGSGKTEVYLQVAAETLRRGRGAIVLVPEIGLTPQTVGRFVERFGDTVAVLHSRLTVAQRREEWRRLRTGEARICVGPRSAVFAPIERLGLIVVDEEHESSYKHEGDPRYDARAVAARRARDCAALLLLGSATPRPESVHAAGAGGTLRLSSRVDRRPLPEVSVLDMCEQPHALHPSTAQALAEVRARRGKAIVLLNRRGWSNFLTCGSCGAVWTCPDCDVALVLHRAEGGPAQPARLSETGGAPPGPVTARGAGRPAAQYIACHHCGYRERAPQRCACGSASVARHGAGTERLEHELAGALGGEGFPVFRLDADTAGETAAADGGVGALLSRFEQAPAGVLIGTQMVAKGHDFPGVSLGVVLDADATLRFPDFRAEERTFSLLTQLAGRVGRGRSCPPARVLVQTMAPGARSIVHAVAHDSDGFVAGELERRRALDYPPFASLVRIVCSAERSERARGAATELRSRLSESGRTASEQARQGRTLSGHRQVGSVLGTSRSSAVVLGPASLFKLRGRERWALVVKAPPALRTETVSRIGAAVQELAGARAHVGVAISVDVDPQ